MLTFEEMDRLVDVFADLGVDKVRLTGGEPLLRRDLASLVRMLSAKPGLADLSMTTNGVLLSNQIEELRAAGLGRVTVSLDTLRADRFVSLTRVDELDQPRFGFTLGHMGAMVPLPDMAYVIVQPCVGVKDASCVEVCPVDCIHTDEAATMYFIDPDECIDCGACVDPCPVDAIFPEDEVPEQWRNFIQINADYFKNR